MKRYKKIVLDVEEGINFEISEKENGELIIRAINTKKANIYSKKHENPVVPEGYKHICGKWNNGFVIERCSDGSQFVWIPVGSLDSNGTLDGNSFTQKFGRRIYRNNKFSEFYETFSKELELQFESIKKYGGFYISRYNISKNKKTGEPQSVKGEKPWTNINFDDAKKVASIIENNKAVKSHLTFGAEYDSVLEWFINSKARTINDIEENSTNWGNYKNTESSLNRIAKTGSNEEWCTNNIYDFAGNVDVWTQEQNKSSDKVIRGGNYRESGNDVSVAYRYDAKPVFKDKGTGFRAALYIK